LPERKVFQQQVAARTKTSSKGNNQEPKQAEHETSFTLEQTKLDTKFIYLIRRQIDILARHNVTFRWRDSAHGNKKRLMTLPVDEFLRRFLLHLLPPGFVRIRNFGFLANRNRTSLLPLCFQLLSGSEKMPASVASPSPDQNHSLWNCPVCGATMRVVERLSAAQLLLRSPPQPDRCAA